MFKYSVFLSPFGWMGILYKKEKVIRILLPNIDKEYIISKIVEGIDKEKLEVSENLTLQNEIISYFEGKRVDFRKFKVELDGFTDFQRKVLLLTQKIPYGKTLTYKDIAKKLGNYRAVRAVGRALSINPVPIAIPCHRVICSNRTLGGFKEGVEWKRRLLLLEGYKIACGT